MTDEEQCGFMERRNCTDAPYALQRATRTEFTNRLVINDCKRGWGNLNRGRICSDLLKNYDTPSQPMETTFTRITERVETRMANFRSLPNNRVTEITY